MTRAANLPANIRHNSDTLQAIPMDSLEISSGQTMQRTQTEYTTAVHAQVKRNLADVQRQLLDEARLAGDEFFYGWSAGKDRIEGPSVKLANSLYRCFMNLANKLRVEETRDAYFFYVTIIDLQTGVSYERPFRQSKEWTVHGKLDDQRKADIRFQIGASKAFRNAIFNFLPSFLVNKAMEAAKSGATDEMNEMIAKHGKVPVIEKALAKLAKEGVKEEFALAKFGVAKREALEPEHLVIMQADLRAITAGAEFASTLYPAMEEQKDKGDDLRDEVAQHFAESLGAVIQTGTPAEKALEQKAALEKAADASPAKASKKAAAAVAANPGVEAAKKNAETPAPAQTAFEPDPIPNRDAIPDSDKPLDESQAAEFDASMNAAPDEPAAAPASSAASLPKDCDLKGFLDHVRACAPENHGFGDAEIIEKAQNIVRVTYPTGRWSKMDNAARAQAWSDVGTGKFFANSMWTKPIVKG